MKKFYLYNISKIFTLKEKIHFLFLIILSSISSIFEMLGIFLVLPVTTFLFDIQKNKEYPFFSDFFYSIQDYFTENYKIIIVGILILIFTLKFIFLFFFNFFQVKFLYTINAKLDQIILLKKLKSSYKDFTKIKSQDFTQPILRETVFFVQRVILQLLIIISDIPLLIFFMFILFIESQPVFYFILILFSFLGLIYFLIIKKKMKWLGKIDLNLKNQD